MLEGETREEAIKRYQEAKASWEKELEVARANPNEPLVGLVTGLITGKLSDMIPELERVIANCDKELESLNAQQ